MALKLQGNFAFTLQVGDDGPTLDPQFGVYRRNETWQGKKSDLATFAASRAPGSAHPTIAWLKLAGFEPVGLEAGMTDVYLQYVGHPDAGGSVPGPSATKRSLQTGTQKGELWREFDWWGTESGFGGSTTRQIYHTKQFCEAEAEWSAYVPNVTFRYCRFGAVTSHQYSALAATALAGESTMTVSEAKRQTSSAWLHNSGFYIDGGALPAGAFNLRQWFVPTAANAPSTAPRGSDLICEPIGFSGWFTVEETHEIPYTQSA